MDQNIVLIITNVIVLVAALGGAAIGAILTYRFSLDQENRRKKREVIEDLYGLALKIYAEVDTYLSYGPNIQLSIVVTDYLIRMQVLTDLYFEHHKAIVADFYSRVQDIEDAHRRQYNAQDDYGHAIIGDTTEYDQAKEAYIKSFNKLIETFQKLAKGVELH